MFVPIKTSDQVTLGDCGRCNSFGDFRICDSLEIPMVIEKQAVIQKALMPKMLRREMAWWFQNDLQELLTD